MAIRDLQVRFATVGAIRLGALKPTRSGRLAPSKLERFRITVRDRALADEIAELYGGEVQIWKPKQGNPGFEIFTEAPELPVYVPRQNIDPNYEMWGPNVLQRRCDGVTEQIRQTPCICLSQARATAEARGFEFDEDAWRRSDDAKKVGCKPTTRLSVILADVSVTGQFKLESHGWNAATELSVWAPIVAMATSPLPAKIVLEKREKKIIKFAGGVEKIETNTFSVPVLDFGDLQLTGRQAFGGGAAAIERAAKRSSAIAAGVNEPVAAIESSNTKSSEQWMVTIEMAETREEMINVRDAIKAAGLTDMEVVNFWKSKMSKISNAKTEQPAETTTVKRVEPAPKPIQVPDIEDAEVEPAMDDVWTEILTVAGKMGYKVKDVQTRYASEMGHDCRSNTATGFSYQKFLEILKGEQ